MLKKSMQRVGMVLALAAALTLAAPSPGAAAPLRNHPQESFWARVLNWLAGGQGMGIDPDGGHSPAVAAHGARGLISLRGDLGAGIDPTGKPSGATPSGDLGAGIDPNGGH